MATKMRFDPTPKVSSELNLELSQALATFAIQSRDGPAQYLQVVTGKWDDGLGPDQWLFAEMPSEVDCAELGLEKLTPVLVLKLNFHGYTASDWHAIVVGIEQKKPAMAVHAGPPNNSTPWLIPHMDTSLARACERKDLLLAVLDVLLEVCLTRVLRVEKIT